MSLKEKFNDLLEQISRQEAAYVRIAVIGQPGAGKSTLINRLIGKKVAQTGQGTDITKQVAEYEYNFQKIVDLPGYGTENYKFDDWKEQFTPQKYDLYLFVFSGKLTVDDEKLFDSLREWNEDRARPLYLVRNHSEDLTAEEKSIVTKDILNRLHSNEKVYFVDCRYKTGLNELQEAVLATNFKSIWHERIYKTFTKAKVDYLNSSRNKAKDEISFYCKAAMANGINPFLGADVAADLVIYFKMFNAIREQYDIEKGDLNKYVMPIAKKLLELLTKEGIMILLKNFAGKATARTILKYIPFAGQAASVAISYKMASYAGENYDEDCYIFADEVMDQLIQEKMAELTIG